MGNEDLLTRISKTVTKCERCRLAKTRIKAVPGVGNPKTKLILIGEAPGMNEDQQGLPFVGRAGQLLNELLASIKMTRSDVWIGNVIKCRPPENREPMVDELRSCVPYLDDQIKAINPMVIVTLGKHAMEHFLKDSKISRDHGVAKLVGNFIVYPIYHPAAALRSDNVKRVLKEDFLKIPSILAKDRKDFKVVGGNAKKGDENQMSLV